MGEEMYEKICNIINKLNIDKETGVITTAKGGNGTVDVTGYLVFKMNQIKFQLHQVLAVMHFGEDCIGMTVNHINGNKTDNSISNLELLTLSENAKHEHKTGLANYSWQESARKRVRQLDKNGITIAEHESTYEISKSKGFSAGSISEVCNKKRKSAYGFLWEFV